MFRAWFPSATSISGLTWASYSLVLLSGPHLHTLTQVEKSEACLAQSRCFVMGHFLSQISLSHLFLLFWGGAPCHTEVPWIGIEPKPQQEPEATAVTTPDPYPTEPQGDVIFIFFVRFVFFLSLCHGSQLPRSYKYHECKPKPQTLKLVDCDAAATCKHINAVSVPPANTLKETFCSSFTSK